MPKRQIKRNLLAKRPLTRKQKAFADHILNNPKKSATEAANRSYDVKKRSTAEVIAYENLRKPQIMQYLQTHASKAELALIEGLEATKKVFKQDIDTGLWGVVGEDIDHTSRLKAADSILDRVHGKATQRIEQQSTGVVITVDLSGTVEETKT